MPDERSDNTQPRTEGFLTPPFPWGHVYSYTPPKDKQQVVPFKSWYASNYCNEEQLSILLWLQHCFPHLQRGMTIYFKFWSCTGETEFYTAFLPMLAWLGMWHEVLDTCVLMCLGQYITGTLKDAAGCPRPPCPPVELRGRASTSQEYGYPSTHASHSVLFSYCVYNLLVLLFPTHDVACTMACIFFTLNVSLSRLFLGMHWPADVVAGIGVACLIVLSHMAFLRVWILAIASLTRVEVWHYLLAFFVMHILAVFHAVPSEICPCYLDSLRFLGATLGALFGGWTMYTHYGTYACRTQPLDLRGTLFSWSFLFQYVCCLLVVAIGKEGTAFVARPLLSGFFSFVSRGAAPNRPWLWRQIINLISNGVRFAYRIPLNEGPGAYTANWQGKKSTFDNGCETEYVGKTASILGISMQFACEENMVPKGPLQLWSPRTHRHWWLWEAHRYTVSYFAVGFMVTYVCPVILRVFFRVN
ncbi:sphingosine-1-phosphate phosphatase, putative [Trypanosoma cruzi marinkellei]|uniref:Sphingosine-1-phosphate phosphatase, putative n=1 Tax=Trypanosoma cruzi marinkellei TaxID=85056 RepID=K2N5Q8_TRYCR|nr:sphingosine-1-phosphate phosphatase, putative [Trypanosoma cruzi marinkellei]